MPTPDDAMLSPVEHEGIAARSTCPPDESRIAARRALHSQRADSSIDIGHGSDVSPLAHAGAAMPAALSQQLPAGAQSPTMPAFKAAAAEIEAPERDTPTPVTAEDGIDEQRASLPAVSAPYPYYAHLMSPFPSQRFLPNTSSSLLRPGSRFVGKQTSDRQQYEVEVEIKHVDMRESFMCGYLRIKGLTEDHPSLTTYFEGEIIGSKYTFITQHPEWGSNEKVDRQHWARFGAYKPLSKYSSRPDLVAKDWMQKDHLFMRWKEYFLVPDHRVRTISGASFEGFYYICFNQVHGAIEGIYFHAKSEKYQKLSLEHVPDHGCQGAIEFR